MNDFLSEKLSKIRSVLNNNIRNKNIDLNNILKKIDEDI